MANMTGGQQLGTNQGKGASGSDKLNKIVTNVLEFSNLRQSNFLKPGSIK